MKRTSNLAGQRLPFPVEASPHRHPIIGTIVRWVSRLIMILGFAGKAALLGFLGAIAIYALISSGVINPTYEDGSRPFTSNEFVVFAASLLAFGVVGFLLDSAGKKMLYLGRKLDSIDALTVLNRDHRRPVLFLRSFDDDDIDDPTLTGPLEWKRRRYEERLSRALHKLGPVVCLGRPGEAYSETGAARLYVGDEHWQEAVLYLLKESCIVVIIVGDTESLSWEIETVISNFQLSKVLFFFPYVARTNLEQSLGQRLMQRLFPMNVTKKRYHQMEAERQRRYQIFCNRFGSLFNADLPCKLDEEQFLDFSNKGEARLLKTQRPIFSSLAIFLQRPFRMHLDFSRTLRPFISKQSLKVL